MTDVPMHRDPVCPTCRGVCGTRTCRPEAPDVCCEDCPEVNRLPKRDRAEVRAILAGAGR